jgi:hypothetical protein
MVVGAGEQAVMSLVDRLETISAGIFSALDRLRDNVETLYADAPDHKPKAADLARLRTGMIGNLGKEGGLVVGSGYIAAPDMLRDRSLWIEWWTSERDGRPSRLVVDLDPTSTEFLDYTRQTWFVVPRDEGHRHITGPYVDYVCTDEYTVTFTVPAYLGGTFLGVVGSDIYVNDFEFAVLPQLRALGSRAAIVNAQGRVIVSTSIRQATGSLVRDPDVAAMWPASERGESRSGAHRLQRCADLPIALLTQEP